MQANASSFIASQLALFAARSPDATALVDVSTQHAVSFHQLEAAFLHARTALGKLGDLEQRVLVLPAENSIDKIIAWLAIWSLGGVVMNLDNRHVPPLLQQALIDRVEPDVLLHDPAQGERPLHTQPIRWCINDTNTWKALPLPRETRLPPGTALINITTGTSGVPKLVYHRFSALLHHGQVSIQLLNLKALEPCLEARSFNWLSAQILSLMPFLLLGTQLHIAPYFSARRFQSWVQHYGIRFAATVPTMLNALLNTEHSEDNWGQLDLTRLSCSSAPLPDNTWRQAEARFQAPVINLYGSSEAGWICGSDAVHRQIGTVGFAAPALKLQRLPNGQAWVESEHLALAVQSTDQSAPETLQGRLMIPDHIQIADDGRVRLLGRSDDIINRSGIKIHPTLIEESITQHPHVKQAVVFGVDDAHTGQAIACAVVADPALSLCALQDYVAKESGLPPSLRPQHWWRVDDIPQVGNGKVSRKALTQRFLARQSCLRS